LAFHTIAPTSTEMITAAATPAMTHCTRSRGGGGVDGGPTGGASPYPDHPDGDCHPVANGSAGGPTG